MIMVEAGTKGKRPPTFQHLPVNRAKKLKQTWVQNTKIKSKWKAERKKQGLEARHGLSSLESGREDGNEVLNESPGRPVDKITDAEVIPPRKSIRPSHNEPNQWDAQISQSIIESTGPVTPDLRDLTREAYSPSSLHTYRSDPLNRRGGRGRRWRGKGRDGQGERRGQPNMKLRMGAMLEKIKQDFM